MSTKPVGFKITLVSLHEGVRFLEYSFRVHDSTTFDLLDLYCHAAPSPYASLSLLLTTHWETF